MQQVSVILSEHRPVSLNGQHGPYTLHKFKAQDGTWFQTTKTPIANEAYALLNQPVTLTYEPTPRGEYVNNVIHSVMAGGDVVAAPTGGAPTGGAPTGGAPTGAAQAASAPQGGNSRAEYQRSKEEMRWTAALEIASRIMPDGTDYNGFLKIAARVEKDIANGNQAAASEPQAQTSSSSVGDEQAAAPAVAADAPPQAELASAPAGPSDDIPF